MAGLSDILERSIIVFPRALDSDETEKLFDYFSKNGIEIQYSLEIIGTKKNNCLDERYCSKISGNLTDTSIGFNVLGNFNCVMKNENADDDAYAPKAYELQFSNPLMDDIDEVSGEVVLWDKVRNLTQQYFLGK